MTVWLGLAAAFQAQSFGGKTESLPPEAHCKGGGKRSVWTWGPLAWRATDRRSTGCGGTAERGRFAFFSHISPSRLMFSPQKPVTLCWFVFGWKSNGEDCKASLMCLVYIEAELYLTIWGGCYTSWLLSGQGLSGHCFKLWKRTYWFNDK